MKYRFIGWLVRFFLLGTIAAYSAPQKGTHTHTRNRKITLPKSSPKRGRESKMRHMVFLIHLSVLSSVPFSVLHIENT